MSNNSIKEKNKEYLNQIQNYKTNLKYLLRENGLKIPKKISLNYNFEDLLNYCKKNINGKYKEKIRGIEDSFLEIRGNIVKNNEGLVKNVVLKNLNPYLDFCDLMLAGNEGLMIATNRYNPKKGENLSTFAYFWIKQLIQRSLLNDGREIGSNIRTPPHIVDRNRLVYNETLKFEKENGRKPSIKELAKKLKMNTTKIKNSYQSLLIKYTSSLERKIINKEDQEYTIIDIIPSKEEEKVMEKLEKQYPEHPFLKIISTFNVTIRDKVIISLRYNLGEIKKPIKLREIGDLFNPPLTRERTRQITVKVIKKLKNVITNGNKDYYIPEYNEEKYNNLVNKINQLEKIYLKKNLSR